MKEVKVKLKTWDEMASEYKIDSYWDIGVDEIWFSPLMESFVPDNRIINVTVTDDGFYQWGCWVISKEMIKGQVK